MDAPWPNITNSYFFIQSILINTSFMMFTLLLIINEIEYEDVSSFLNFVWKESSNAANVNYIIHQLPKSWVT
jgi:hypothetical protein